MNEVGDLAARDQEVLEEHLRLLDGGAHFLQTLAMRDVPPITGDFAMELDVTPQIKNPRGGVQGGLVATLADTGTGKLTAISTLSFSVLAPRTSAPDGAPSTSPEGNPPR